MSQIRHMDGETEYIRSLGRFIEVPRCLEMLAVRRAQKGCPKAIAWLIRQHSRIVLNIAQRYGFRGLTVWDLYSEGRIGLLEAIPKFDPTCGVSFMTYAGWWVRQKIGRACMNDGGLVRIPVHVHEWRHRVQGAEKALLEERNDGRPVSDEDLAYRVSLTLADRADVKDTMAAAVKAVAKYRGLRGLTQPCSLDAPMNGSADPLLEHIEGSVGENAMDGVARAELRQQLNEALAHLSPREQHVLELRILHEKTLEEVAETVHSRKNGAPVTRERVRQIEQKAIKKLRKALQGRRSTLASTSS